MQHEIFKKYMMSFPVEALKDFLGRDLVDSLLEWSSEKEAMFKKSRLADMIISIYGVNVLKNKKFRNQLFKSLPKEELLSFREVLSKEFLKTEVLIDIVNAASSVKWGNNQVNNKLLTLLGYNPDDIFAKSDEQDDPIETINSYDKFYELLDYQYIIRQKALNILSSKKELSRLLIHMPTGTGKTKTATHIICQHYNYNLNKKGLVIWIAHTTELIQQAYDTFVSVWKNIGNGSINTYKLWGNYSINNSYEELSGFMVCSIQKLQVIEKSEPGLFEKLIHDASLIVYDEAHKACAQGTRTIIEKFMIKKGDMCDRSLLGLTATPGRSTETSIDNDLLVSMFGNKIISIDTKLMNAVNMSAQEAINTPHETDVIKYFQNRGVLAKIKKEELKYSESLSNAEINSIRVVANANGYDDFSTKTLEFIGRNKSRNLRIMQKLRQLNKEGVPTIAFACSVKHGQLLSSMLSLENIPNALVIGDMSTKERAESIDAFKDRSSKMNILINYEVLTTGFDATNIKCVFITRPTQSIVLYSQMLGRGLRGPQMGGNEECLLVDIKDNLNQYNENMAFSHFDNYWKV